MRRGIAAVVAGIALAMLAGCAPAGVDGNLTDDWPALPEPTIRVPVVGDCWSTTADVSVDVTTSNTSLVDSCSLSHQTETAHVGQFSGSAVGKSVPAADSAAMRAAYRDCAAATKDYLGGDWYDARLDLVLLTPSAKQWAVGARYYRCDLVSIRTYRHDLVTAHDSAKDGLRGARPLAMGCIDVTRDSDGINTVDPADCAKSHSGEYAGTYLAPAGPYSSSVDVRRRIGLDGCQHMVARFLGLSFPIARTDIAWLSTGFVKDHWAYGDRGDRCFAMAYNSAKKTTGSIKGLGGKPLPK
ncbi:MAG TPA: septum formation family protein [Micromonosporaceae bacterium]